MTMDDSPIGGIVNNPGQANGSEKCPKAETVRTRPWKRRSSKACTSCRVRKVRCDLLLLGKSPCSNCKHDEIDCCLPPPKRRRRLTEMMPEEVVSQIDTKSSPEVDCAAGLDVLDAFSPANIQEWQRLSLEFPDFDEQPSKMDDSTMEMPIMSWDHFEEQLQPSPISDLPEPIASSWDDFRAETQQILAHANPLPTPASPSSLYSDSTERSRISRQPVSEFSKIFHAKIERDVREYLQRIESKIKHDIHEYMQRIEVLSVPQQPLQDALLKSYIEFVHGHFPLIDPLID